MDSRRKTTAPLIRVIRSKKIGPAGRRLAFSLRLTAINGLHYVAHVWLAIRPRPVWELQRDPTTLDEEVTSDKFFNFLVTTDSLRKWLENDPSVPASAQRGVLSLYVDKYLKACRDLANGSKHFTITPKITVSATSDTGLA
jgi:hypothetical protein